MLYFKVQLKVRAVGQVRVKVRLGWVREGYKHVHVLQNVLKDGFIDPHLNNERISSSDMKVSRYSKGPVLFFLNPLSRASVLHPPTKIDLGRCSSTCR